MKIFPNCQSSSGICQSSSGHFWAQCLRWNLDAQRKALNKGDRVRASLEAPGFFRRWDLTNANHGFYSKISDFLQNFPWINSLFEIHWVVKWLLSISLTVNAPLQGCATGEADLHMWVPQGWGWCAPPWWRLVRHILAIGVSTEKANKKDVACPRIINSIENANKKTKQISISKVLEASIWHQTAQQWGCQLPGLCSGLQPQRGRSFSVRQPVPEQPQRTPSGTGTGTGPPRQWFSGVALGTSTWRWGNDWWETSLFLLRLLARFTGPAGWTVESQQPFKGHKSSVEDVQSMGSES